jgi:hypothetical protein
MFDDTKALLIVCRTLNPFVNFDLLVDDQTAKPDIEKIKIADLFFNLNEQDEKFGHHVVDDILNDLVEACRKEKRRLVLGKGELVEGDYPTIESLASALVTSSKNIKK